MKAHQQTMERDSGKESLWGLGNSRLQGTRVESSRLPQPTFPLWSTLCAQRLHLVVLLDLSCLKRA